MSRQEHVSRFFLSLPVQMADANRIIRFKPFRFGRAERITIATLIVLTILVIGVATIPSITSWYDRVNNVWTEWAIRYGYFGSFIAALIGNLTVFIIFPYTVVTFFLATQGLDPFWLGFLTGTGAFIGELSGYVLGRWGSKRFQQAKPEAYDAMVQIVASRPGFVQWLLFLFSLLPLPDDVLFIPLGMLRYPVWKLAWPSWIGKVGAGLAITYAGNLFVHTLDGASATSPGAVFSQLGSLYAVVLAIYAMFRLDWGRMMHQLLDGHPKAAQTNQEPPAL